MRRAGAVLLGLVLLGSTAVAQTTTTPPDWFVEGSNEDRALLMLLEGEILRSIRDASTNTTNVTVAIAGNQSLQYANVVTLLQGILARLDSVDQALARLESNGNATGATLRAVDTNTSRALVLTESGALAIARLDTSVQALAGLADPLRNATGRLDGITTTLVAIRDDTNGTRWEMLADHEQLNGNVKAGVKASIATLNETRNVGVAQQDLRGGQQALLDNVTAWGAAGHQDHEVLNEGVQEAEAKAAGARGWLVALVVVLALAAAGAGAWLWRRARAQRAAAEYDAPPDAPEPELETGPLDQETEVLGAANEGGGEKKGFLSGVMGHVRAKRGARNHEARVEQLASQYEIDPRTHMACFGTEPAPSKCYTTGKACQFIKDCAALHGIDPARVRPPLDMAAMKKAMKRDMRQGEAAKVDAERADTTTSVRATMPRRIRVANGGK